MPVNVQACRPQVLDWLLTAGADPNARRTAPPGSRKDLREGWTPLFALVKASLSNELRRDVARKLMAAGASVDAMPQRFRVRFETALASWKC
jgi:hypothetical protein